MLMDAYALAILIVIATAIWVAFDAPTHGLSWTWSLGVLALWIVAFPWYLSVRSTRIRLERADGAQATSARKAGWHADPLSVRRFRYHDGQRWTEHTSNDP